jgi:serine/threonine-protein kinase
MPSDADRNLLFGFLALQAGWLNAAQLAEASAAWASGRDRSMAELLVERGLLSKEQRAGVDQLVEGALQRFAGDARASLKALSTPQVTQILPSAKAGKPLTEVASSDGLTVLGDAAVPQWREGYTLARLYARGGMGQVWVAHDQELGRDVALKELRPERADKPAVLARFLEEARITGRLEHPGVVPVYGLVRRPEGGPPFYTMRLVRGLTLADAIQAYHQKREAGAVRPLDLRELLNAFVAVCNAVAYAHSRGVLHRDIKPQNVVLGDFGEVVVLDWGLAKHLGAKELPGDAVPAPAASTESADRTIQGQVLGTPGYMAPEQAEGRLDQLDERTDVYGLGAVLYEVLTGRAPFSGEDTPTVLRQVVLTLPTPPRQLVGVAPAALEAVCLKALAKERERRYAGARELGREVQHWLADEPVAAYREPWPARARRWLGRHRTLAASAAAAALVAVLSLSVATAFLQVAHRRQREARGRAEENFRLAQDAVDRGFTRVSDNPLLKAQGLEKLRAELLAQAKDFYERMARAEDAEPSVQAERGRAYVRLAEITDETGDRAQAILFAKQGRAIFAQLTREHPGVVAYQGELADALGRLGLCNEHDARYAEAQGWFDRALAVAETLVRAHPDNPQHRRRLAETLYRLGALCQQHTNQPDRARDAYEQAVPLYEGLSREQVDDPGHRLMLAGALSSLGNFYSNTGRADRADALYEKAFALAERLVAEQPDLPKAQALVAYILQSKGLAYHKAGQSARAMDAFDRALPVYERLARAHPDVPAYQASLVTFLKNFSLLATAAGQSTRGITACESDLPFFDVLARGHPDVPQYSQSYAQLLEALAIAYGEVKQFTAAAALYEKALPVFERLATDRGDVPDYELQRALVRVSYAHVLACMGRHARASAEVETALGQARQNSLVLYNGACVCGLCSQAARQDAGLGELERHDLGERYAVRCLGLLRQAVSGGFRDADYLNKDSDLDPVRARDDFKAFLQELKRKDPR